MKTDNKVVSCIGILTVLVVTTITGTIMNGWALTVLWIWFIIPVFNLPTLSIIQAIGIGMVVTFLTRHSINKEEAAKDTGAAIWTAIVSAVIVPLLTVGIGYIISLFL